MTETYSKSTDFGNQLAPGQLVDEIEADGTIVTNLLRIDVNADVVDIVFESTISGAEKTALDALVAAHVPAPTNNIFSVPGYIELNSSLADTGSIRIQASNAAGGIDIDAGTGGIAMDTTNGFNLNAGAAISIANTAGNIELDTPALINLNAQSGINIGNDADAAPVNIGTGSAAKTISIGNSTGATAINLDAGTGGISLDATGASCNFTLASTGDAQDLTIALTGSNNSSLILSSSGTGSDAIIFNTSGGIDADATGTINFATGSSAGGAITLDAAFNNGGLTLAAGSQGIAINSGTGLIGIGHWSAGDIQIGNSATARTITIGNTTSTTAVNINTGTGDFNLNSQDAILLDCAGVLEMNSSGGVINIGNDAVNQNMNIGTSGSRVITIGNTSASSAVNIVSGSFGATFGNDASGGEIQIAASANAKTVKVGNDTSGSRLFHRWGTGGHITYQPTHTSLSNASATLSVAQLLTQILTMTPTIGRTLTLPTAAGMVSGISGIAVNDCIEFRIMNLQASASDPQITVAMGTGGTAIGRMIVDVAVNNAATYVYSGTGVFRLRMTNVTASSEAYTVYRIA